MKKIKIAENFYFSNNSEIKFILGPCQIESKQHAFDICYEIERLSKKTDLPVYIAEDPLQAVVRGTGIALKNIDKFKSVLIK